MDRDYFVVGPTVALRSRPPLGPSRGPRLDFSVESPGQVLLGTLRTELLGGVVEVRPAWEQLGFNEDQFTEALRLLARVLRKLTPAPLRVPPECAPSPVPKALAGDGFRRGDDANLTLHGPVIERSTARASGMAELYEDPFRVIWNFEPRPWDVLGGLVSLMSGLGGARVLDVGCGFGKDSVLLEGLGFETHGVDIAERAIDLCRRWVRHPERFRAASVTGLPFPDHHFDAVLDIGCLHLLPRRHLSTAARELGRVLRPGGWLFSRILRRRDAAWLGGQRYEASAVGLEPPEIVHLLGASFELALRVSSESTAVTGMHRG